MGGTRVPPFLDPGPVSPRGTGPESYWSSYQAWEDWVLGLLNNSFHLIDGVSYGVLFGKPILQNGKEIGRTPGMMPQDLDKFSARAQNMARFSMLGPLQQPINFGQSVAYGLWTELKGMWDLAASVFNGALFKMISDGLNAIASSPLVAFRLGEGVGGGMVEKLSTAVEGTFEQYVAAMGELLGSLLPDLIVAFFTAGGGMLLKEGASVGIRAARESFDLAAEIAKKGRRHLDEFVDLIDDLRPQGSLVPVGGYPSGGMPRPARAPYVFMNEASRGVEAGKRATGVGGKGATATSPTPSTTPDVPGASLNPGRGAAGGAASEAFLVAKRKAISAAVRTATKEADRLMVLGQRGQLVPEYLPNRKPDASLSTPPELGPLLKRGRDGDSLGAQYDDLADLVQFMSRTAGAGGVYWTNLRFLDQVITLGETLGPFKTGLRVIQTHSSAILQTPPVVRAKFKNFNGDAYWTSRRRAFETEIMPALEARLAREHPELVPLIKEKWNALHSLGPGAGDEIALGMGFGPAWINQKVQAGGFRNKVLDILTRRDARRDHGLDPSLANPYLDEVAGTRQYDRYGLEGILIDYARTVERASGEGKRFPKDSKVLLDTFTESWGDELLKTDLFKLATEKGITLRPQDFVRSVEYRMRLVHPVGGDFVGIPGQSMALRLDMAPPPFFKEARVTILDDPFKVWSGDAAKVTLSRATVIGE